MSAVTTRLRCAVYTRKSTEEGLEQDYNSIDAQRDAGHAYITSQRAQGWTAVGDDYDDPAYSGGNIERPALQRLLQDTENSANLVGTHIHTCYSLHAFNHFFRHLVFLQGLINMIFGYHFFNTFQDKVT